MEKDIISSARLAGTDVIYLSIYQAQLCRISPKLNSPDMRSKAREMSTHRIRSIKPTGAQAGRAEQLVRFMNIWTSPAKRMSVPVHHPYNTTHALLLPLYAELLLRRDTALSGRLLPAGSDVSFTTLLSGLISTWVCSILSAHEQSPAGAN